ncbi:MAG: hypothetical protein KDA38_08260 [Planctomycetales bacterium]|nr:hypothetical protein [Planctomycetales bacterium]
MNDVASSPPNASHSSLPLIEVGWIVAGRMDAVDREAIELARREVLELLQHHLPFFDWRMPAEEQEELGAGLRVESTELLERGVAERSARRWDFVLVLTAAELISHYQQHSVSAISRSLQGTVISTTRIDPAAKRSVTDRQERLERMTQRIVALVLHALGHWAGLDHAEDDSESYMRQIGSIEELDHLHEFTDVEWSLLERALHEIGDRRLEEEHGFRVNRPLTFYVQAAWINRGDLFRAIWEAQPWQFPFRLSRLTTASVSTVLVLMMTAEAWDLGIQQPVWRVALLSIAAILGTTGYILVRQRLLVRFAPMYLSEQIVMTNVATLCIVLVGMLTTYFGLVGLAMLLSCLLFPTSLVNGWAASYENDVSRLAYLHFSSFAASLAILIGALGASFEQQYYFRHVTYVDEEI